MNLFYLWNDFSACVRIRSSLNIFYFTNFSFVGLQNLPSIISLRFSNGIYFSYTFHLFPNMQNKSFSVFKGWWNWNFTIFLQIKSCFFHIAILKIGCAAPNFCRASLLTPVSLKWLMLIAIVMKKKYCFVQNIV